MNRSIMRVVATAMLVSGTAVAAQWGRPVAPVIPTADGYIAVPSPAVPPLKTRLYRAVFDATRAADKPDQLVPALNMAGSELNVLGATGVPLKNARFVVVFHGAGVEGILDNPHYRARYHVDNPNLPVIAAMKRAGVELFVCGQYLGFMNIDPATLTPDVKVATDALIVLMAYQNDGYALLSF